MKILPLKTIPKRAQTLLNTPTFWPMKTRVVFSFVYLYARLKNGFKGKTLLCFPEYPQPFHVIYKICKKLGWKITNDPTADADLAIYFEDITVRSECSDVEKVKKRMPVLNSSCCNISKEYIDTVFKEVFGYEMSIDPRTHVGKCVKKSNINALHDGLVVDCPVEPEEGYVYQKLILATCGDDRVMDLRIPIFGERIPFIIKRYRSMDDIFIATIDMAFADTDELLSKDEQEKIITYCKKLGLDYGELDALRDGNDGRLYVVDVNNTPAGPNAPFYKDRKKRSVWLERMSKAYTEHIVQKYTKNV
jgi:hypothetical protein